MRARNCSRLRRIEDHAFYSCTMLAELRLPEGRTYIGPWAFAWDRILGQEDTTLGLPSSLQTISTGAFAFVNHHKNLNIPANVTSIGDYAFMCDYYMNNLTFSPGDKKLTIGKAAFFGDNHMKSVDLSNRVAQIDRCAFAGCEMLEEAYFGDKIDTIEGRAFTSLDNAMKLAVEGVLNGILRPDDTEQNADQAGDISTALNMIAKVTKLKRAVFKNDPAKSICAAADGKVWPAVIGLALCGLCDMFDGKIARATKRTKDAEVFGIQIDSLCDLVSFGVLPSAIGHAMGITGVAMAGLMFYTLCAVIRLGYFNVTEQKRQETTSENRTSFEGLPVTWSAVIVPLVSLVRLANESIMPWVMGGVLFIVGFCFIARIRVRKPQI